MWDKPQILMKLANLLYALAAVLVLYAALFLLVHLPVVPLNRVEVKGQLEHVTREQVRFIVQREMQGNFFTVDLARVRRAFEKLPWVRGVNVRRRWPDRIEVTLEEHVALARWGSVALVNSHGELFQAASGSLLPVFAGPAEGVKEMTRQYARFRQLLEPIRLHPGQIMLNHRGAWQLRLDSGMTVELGREQVEARLARFVGVYEKTLGMLAVPVGYVDLRYPNGFAVRRPGAAAGAAGSKT